MRCCRCCSCRCCCCRCCELSLQPTPLSTATSPQCCLSFNNKTVLSSTSQRACTTGYLFRRFHRRNRQFEHAHNVYFLIYRHRHRASTPPPSVTLACSYAIGECFGTGFPNSAFPPDAANTTRRTAAYVREILLQLLTKCIVRCASSSNDVVAGQQPLDFQLLRSCPS